MWGYVASVLCEKVALPRPSCESGCPGSTPALEENMLFYNRGRARKHGGRIPSHQPGTEKTSSGHAWPMTQSQRETSELGLCLQFCLRKKVFGNVSGTQTPGHFSCSALFCPGKNSCSERRRARAQPWSARKDPRVPRTSVRGRGASPRSPPPPPAHTGLGLRPPLPPGGSPPPTPH